MKIFIFLIIIIFLFLAFYIAFFHFKKTSKISLSKHKEFEKILKKIKSNISSKEKIIDYDKLYHKILQELGYNGSFGDILKLKPTQIEDIDKIWELHKLRNKLAHDFDLLEEKILMKKAKEYEKELEKLLKKIS